MEDQNYKRGNNRIWGGLFLLAVGSALLLERAGFPFPSWLFKWPVILIITGIFFGLKTNFRGPAWAIMLVIGSVFLIESIEPSYALRRYTMPLIIIAVGLVVIFRPKKYRFGDFSQCRDNPQKRFNQHPEITPSDPMLPDPLPGEQIPASGKLSKQDYIDSVAIFGGIRKVIVSKNFKGGDVVAVFGGNEIDLSQADINGQAVLEVTQIIGGTKLILPSHWNVRSEMVAFFGGIEDKRQIPSGVTHHEKILVLRGNSIFGGIDIRNY